MYGSGGGMLKTCTFLKPTRAESIVVIAIRGIPHIIGEA
jgi:hypothetical protein